MIVLVDPLSTGPALSAALIERGETPLHLYGHSQRAAYLRDRHQPKAWIVDLAATIADLAAADVTAVIAGSEWGVDDANAISHALGLPHHVDTLARARRNKASQNRALRAASVPAARTATIVRADATGAYDTGAYDATDDVLSAFDLPVFVKPAGSAGGDGCMLCHDEQDLRVALRRGFGERNLLGGHNDAMLVQDYLDGPQYIVNTVSIGGRHLLSDVHFSEVCQIQDRSVLRHFSLLPVLDPHVTECVEYTFACLDAVGIREGAAHSEVRMTRNGPRLIEVNARHMGASQLPSLFRPALGYSHADLVAERFVDPAAFLERFDQPYAPVAVTAVALLNVPAAGTVLASPGLDFIRALPGFHSLDHLPRAGQTIAQPWTCVGEAGVAYFLHHDSGVVAESLRRLHEFEDAGRVHTIGSAQLVAV